MIHNTDGAIVNQPVICWQNLLTGGALTATSALSGYPVTGLLNGYTADPWIPSAMPATVSLTLPVAAAANSLCIAAHNMGGNAASLSVQWYNGAAWVTAATASPTTDETMMVTFPTVAAAQWRVVFTGSSACTVGVMYLGNSMVIDGLIVPPHVPLNRLSEVELIGSSDSGNGDFLQADTKRTGGAASLTFSVQRPAFVHGAEFEAFRQHFNRGRPFFLASFPTYAPDDVGYCWRSGGNLKSAYSGAFFAALAMEVSVYV